jgi:hypothetical protein
MERLGNRPAVGEKAIGMEIERHDPLPACRPEEHLRTDLDPRAGEHIGNARNMTRPLALGLRANMAERDTVGLGEARLAACLSAGRHRSRLPGLKLTARRGLSADPSGTNANMCSQWHTQPTSARRPDSSESSAA